MCSCLKPTPNPKLRLHAGSEPKAEHKPSTLTNLHLRPSLSPCRLEVLYLLTKARNSKLKSSGQTLNPKTPQPPHRPHRGKRDATPQPTRGRGASWTMGKEGGGEAAGRGGAERVIIYYIIHFYCMYIRTYIHIHMCV